MVISQDRILNFYEKVRTQTRFLCDPLEIEDFVVQPIIDVSPLKWHLGHITWFFETFVLAPNCKGYKLFNDKYPYLFNSYYVKAGDRLSRASRGQLTRPTVKEIFEYRSYVDDQMCWFLQKQNFSGEVEKLIELGCHHEQQHQELFLYDIKQILGDNPLFPKYCTPVDCKGTPLKKKEWLSVDEGIYKIGCASSDSFHFDNEEGQHNVFLHSFEIESGLITNGEYLEFINANGYKLHQYWLSEAWDWVNANQVKAPRYWHQEGEGDWWHYTLGGYEKVDETDPVAHISYYEADAFACWRGCRLPTEVEWETACKLYSPNIPSEANFVEKKIFRPRSSSDLNFYGNLWEWTSSPYTAYPFFKVTDEVIGEYNGKFMVNQMILRGGSFATPKNHIRNTYRNFFHPNLRWLFSGIRLAKYK